MNFFLHDLTGLILGTLILPIIGVLPGFALLRALEQTGFDGGRGWQRLGWALLLAFSMLPVIDASLIRVAGVATAFGVRVALALIASRGLIREAKDLQGPSRALIGFAGLWWLAVAIAYLDVDWNGRLYQSLVAVDLVKHAAVVEAIAHHGLPLHDVFFARTQPAGYYFYYYSLPALLHWVMGDLISARMAFASSLLWAGLAFPAVIWRIGADAGIIRIGRDRSFLKVAILLCFIAGAGLPCVLIEYGVNGRLAPQVELWSEEIRFALTSVIWVPHHMGALIACWTGALLLCRLRTAPRRRDALPVIAAGLCFASAFGMSIWITVTAAPILLSWAAIRFYRSDRIAATALILAGSVAAVVSLPQIFDILHGRSDNGFPIALTVRSFTYWALEADPSNVVLLTFLLATLPIAYAIHFGAFALGSNFFLRLRPREFAHSDGVRSLLLVSAIVSLVIASFLRSTIINNDLGWRSIWFAQMTAMVWTAGAVHSAPRIFMKRVDFRILLMLGLAANIWDIVGLRVIREPYVRARGLAINTAPATDLAERQAYEWAADHLDGNAIVQHNAGIRHRIFNFGLYGHNRPAVADTEANLFGAPRQDVTKRLNALQPIFDRPLPMPDLLARARQQDVDFLLFSDLDPVWKMQGSLPFDQVCAYRNNHVCILPTKVSTP